MEKIYRVQMNSKGMPNFATAVEIEDIPIYGNEHNCMMTIFGECSYSETGCGDCAVVEKVRRALSADRPQREGMTNSEWKEFLAEQWDISKACAKEMLHAMYAVKEKDSIKKRFDKRKGADDE